MMNAPRPAANRLSRPQQIVVAVAALIVGVVGFNLVAGHENKYEKLADEVTHALQTNDLAGAQKYFNAETATKMNHGNVGRDADEFTRLGKIKSVKEITAKDAPERGHEFTVTFERGAVDEKIRLDPDDKIVFFNHVLKTP
jgi:hypothetical protein